MMQSHRASAETIESAKARIKAQFESHPRIRINVAITHSKVVQDADVTITGVYPHVFCVEENDAGTPLCHTFQYADLITRRVEIIGPA